LARLTEVEQQVAALRIHIESLRFQPPGDGS
jgi:hypothetical protein